MNLDTRTALATLSRPLACPRCKGPVDVKSRHVTVAGSAINVYCSEDCRRRSAEPIEEVRDAIDPSPRRLGWLLAGGVAIGTTLLVLSQRTADEPETSPQQALFVIPTPHAKELAVAPAPATPKENHAEDDALLTDLMHDAWIHPLAGPRRRMPINHTAAFGAERGGERPPECASGHCGVDVGGSIWGEQVHCVHDGVVDWVNRGPNEEHGGMFVKISHRGGSLYTWYFHLAAVPRWIQPGVKVVVGQVIGLVGDTGVKNSGPHLHFAMSVKPSKTAHERYLDPEPLIAIWPLWIPKEGTTDGHVTIFEAPGISVRAREHAKAKPESPPEPKPIDTTSGSASEPPQVELENKSETPAPPPVN
ncbi:MAG: Peptidase [Myxococcales bacterium]|nr:Peptidase [Myxococcales bacterium]